MLDVIFKKSPDVPDVVGVTPCPNSKIWVLYHMSQVICGKDIRQALR